MRNNTPYLFAFSALVICYLITTASTTHLDNTPIIPEGYVALNDSVYISQYEVSTGEYKKHIIQDSIMNTYFFPDTLCLMYFNPTPQYGDPYYQQYLCYKHPAYHDYPIIGISHQQALDYCNLRTKKLLKNEPGKFRLPTKEEWQSACGTKNLGLPKKEYRKSILELLRFKESKPKEKWSNIIVADYSIFIKQDSSYTFVKKERRDYGCSGKPPIPKPYNVVSLVPNEYNIHNLIGNVSEMVAEEGIAKGPNFQTPYTENYRDTIIHYTKPEPWLGFRMVYEIKNTK